MVSTQFVLVLGIVAAHAAAESQAAARLRTFETGTGADIDASGVDGLWLASAIAFAGFLGLALYESTSSPVLSDDWILSSLGLFAAATGIRLRCLAIGRLGPTFEQPPFTSAPHALVQDGVFAVVRHPSELGLLLIGTGVALTVPSPTVLSGALALIVLPSLLRIRREERWLKALFPVRHDIYRLGNPRVMTPHYRDIPVLAVLVMGLGGSSSPALEHGLQKTGTRGCKTGEATSDP